MRILLIAVLAAAPVVHAAQYPERWTNGLSTRADYFPIAVWLQSPHRAKALKKAGMNLYIGLWKGPTEAQLAELAKAKMSVICAQNDVGLKSKNSKIIVGWMHGDEPDNAQRKKSGEGYGPPIEPKVIVADYRKIRATDPTRPVILNLGQGVAWDNWVGRGVRTNHPEDYPKYVKGCDIVSFDIYPAVHRSPEVAGKLEFVPKGVRRLRKWTGDKKRVWNCIECTRISNEKVKPTPKQVRAEVWMAIIAGSKGLIYFVHQFKPKFREAALLDDPEMVRAVTAINSRVTKLAPVINSAEISNGATIKAKNPGATIKFTVRRHEGATYLFAANESNVETKADVKIAGLRGRRSAEVLGEKRAVDVKSGRFEATFEPYGVHIYRIQPAGKGKLLK